MCCHSQWRTGAKFLTFDDVDDEEKNGDENEVSNGHVNETLTKTSDDDEGIKTIYQNYREKIA